VYFLFSLWIVLLYNVLVVVGNVPATQLGLPHSLEHPVELTDPSVPSFILNALLQSCPSPFPNENTLLRNSLFAKVFRSKCSVNADQALLDFSHDVTKYS